MCLRNEGREAPGEARWGMHLSCGPDLLPPQCEAEAEAVWPSLCWCELSAGVTASPMKGPQQAALLRSNERWGALQGVSTAPLP